MVQDPLNMRGTSTTKQDGLALTRERGVVLFYQKVKNIEFY